MVEFSLNAPGQVLVPANLRKSRITWLLALMGFFQIWDGFMTYFSVGNGFAKEFNPFTSAIAGTPAFLVLKIVGAIICICLLWFVSRRFPRLALFAAAGLVVEASAIVTWNLFTLFLSPVLA
jgi:hypothetical protein